MVTESTIEKVIQEIEEEKIDFASELQRIIEERPEILAFLDQESNAILTDEEKDILFYITFVLIVSINRTADKSLSIVTDKLESAEEKNWEMWDKIKGGSFYEKLTPFYENYPEEDLLSFIEDTVAPDDDSPITNVGSEVIFIACKSIVDLVKSVK